MAPSELFLILSRIKSHLFGVVRVVDVIDVVRGVRVDVDAFDAGHCHDDANDDAEIDDADD